MNKPSAAALSLLMLLSHGAFAKGEENEAVAAPIDTNVYDKETIKQAMVILLKSRALKVEPKDTVRVHRSLIDELRREGIIEPATARAGTVCVDTTGK